MQTKLVFVVFSSILLFFTACKKTTTSEYTDSPIIESYLNEGDYFNVKISRQVPFSADVTYSSDDINNLTLQVTLNNTLHTLHPLGDGKYIDSSIIVAQNDNYNLSFLFDNKKVTAYTFVPQKPSGVTQSASEIIIARVSTTTGPPSGGFTMPEPIKISWDNSDNSYYLLVVENLETTLDPIRDFGDNAPPSNFFRKQPTNASSEEIRSMEFQYYGKHRIIIYHVLPDYASLYDQSSSSSINLSNPSTSITNGYGIFTGLNSDTLLLDVKAQ